MRLQRESDTLQFTFNHVEARLLLEVFRQLSEGYQHKPEDVDPKTAEAWYSRRGCITARMSEDQTRDWLASLHELKGGNLRRLKAWAKQISDSNTDQAAKLMVHIDEAPSFMTAINDHRLMSAARHDIGQSEMDIQSPAELARLPAERQ